MESLILILDRKFEMVFKLDRVGMYVARLICPCSSTNVQSIHSIIII